jgi:hypothetical protein
MFGRSEKRLNPWRIGKIMAAALFILHIEHNRTT